MSASACLFCKIARGEIPATIVARDDEVTAFKDIHPQAPVHIILIPNRHVASLADEAGDLGLLGRLLVMARQVAAEMGLTASGYRVVTNIGDDGGQSVPHLHLHLLGGRPMAWPPG